MTQSGTEALHAQAKGLQAEPPLVQLAHLLDSQLAAAGAVRAALPAIAEAADRAARALRAGGRLAYAGAGSSGVMALADALELPGTFGVASDRVPVLLAGGAEALSRMPGAAEDDPALARADLARAGFGSGDVVVCVSASGATPYTLAVAEGARAAGAMVVGIANVANSKLLDRAEIPVLLATGPELVAGSTRMGAGTAQKVALNMLSTLTALALGHVYDGRMVNLVADNAKLEGRARRIVADIARVPADTADAMLAAAGRRVKPAILMAAGASAAEAERLLAEHGGHLGPALATLGHPASRPRGPEQTGRTP